MPTLEVTGLSDKDVKTTNGWKKQYLVRMTGMINGVSLDLSLKSEDLDILEEIVPFNKKEQRNISIDPVNHTLAGPYPGAPSQAKLTQEEIDSRDDQDQDAELARLERQLRAAQMQTGTGD